MTDPSREIDIDLFAPSGGFGDPLDSLPAQSLQAPAVPFDAAMAQAMREHEAALAADRPPAPAPKPTKGVRLRPRPAAIIWPSDRGGHLHVATLLPTGPACICEAAQFGGRCWAMNTLVDIAEGRAVEFAPAGG
jgi:hypothetical protein